MGDEIEIDLKALLQTIKQHWLIIAVITVVGAVSGLVYGKFIAVPQYSASAMLIVNNTALTGKDHITSSDIDASQSLADTYAIIIKSDAVLEPVREKMKLKNSAKSLAEKIEVVSVNNTQIIQISIQDPSPNLAQEIIQEILTVAPDIIVEKVEATSCKVINDAKVTENPVSPNIKKLTILGFLVGLVLSAGFFILKEILDDTIHSEEQLMEITGVANLGVIYKK